MGKKKTELTIAGVLFIIGIILVILTWPRLTLQSKFDGGQPSLTVYYPDTAKISVSIWNRGGSISDWRIITPESCTYANVLGNITCLHNSFRGMIPCNEAVCGTSPAQQSSPADEMNLKFSQPYPNNFTISLAYWSSFSFIPISSSNESYFCKINGGTSGSSYNCTKL